MSDIDYFRSRNIANSTLSLLSREQGGHPKWFKSYLNGYIQTKAKYTLEEGTTFHKFVEAPDLFLVADVDRPNENICNIAEEYLKIKDSYIELSLDKILIISARSVGYQPRYGDESLLKALNKTSIKEYISELERLDTSKIILTSATKKIIEDGIATLKEHEGCNRYLFEEDKQLDIQSEVEIYWELIGLQLKSKPDRIRINHIDKTIELIDLKTMGRKSAIFFNESFEFYHYKRQMAMYSLALKTIYPEYRIKCYMPVISYYNFTANCYHISDVTIDSGMLELEYLLNLAKWYIDNNIWHVYKEEYEGNYLLHL